MVYMLNSVLVFVFFKLAFKPNYSKSWIFPGMVLVIVRAILPILDLENLKPTFS